MDVLFLNFREFLQRLESNTEGNFILRKKVNDKNTCSHFCEKVLNVWDGWVGNKS